MTNKSTNASKDLSDKERIIQLELRIHSLERENQHLTESVERKKTIINLQTREIESKGRDKVEMIKNLHDILEDLQQKLEAKNKIIGIMNEMITSKLTKQSLVCSRSANIVHGLNKFKVIYSEVQFN